MIITTGRVHNGKIEVETDSLPEGASVTVLVDEEEETFDLTPEEEARLSLAITQADRGETVTASELLRDLRHS